MANNEEQSTEILNDLIATCHDSEEGYAKAAKGVHDRTISDRLAGISGERERFATELGKLVSRLGGQPASDAHYGGVLHRGWVDLETRIRPKDQHDLLEDCVRGDTGTLKHYDHALQQWLPEDAQMLLREQRTQVQADLDFIGSLVVPGSIPKHA